MKPLSFFYYMHVEKGIVGNYCTIVPLSMPTYDIMSLTNNFGGKHNGYHRKNRK
jgi:hypothetical protein